MREGDFDLRIQFLKKLGDPGGIEFPVESEPVESAEELEKILAFQVVSALVMTSEGRSGGAANS